MPPESFSTARIEQILTDLVLAVLGNTALVFDTYSQGGVAAVGEFTVALKKTFDVSSIPIDRSFLVYAQNVSSDGLAKNAIARIVYNGITYSADSFQQYHINASLTVPLRKVAGQDSVLVYFGGSAASQRHDTHLAQIN